MDCINRILRGFIFNGKDFFENFLIFIALINPISKVVVLSMDDFDRLKKITFRAASTAFFILIIFAYGGTFILRKLFHIEIYA
ncbi:MAG: hypothetical protein NC830_05200 [Candidatus Omnitrophica bacterium]|nr:hypothetical protein [Candidatus Omnitrophota bacterium]